MVSPSDLISWWWYECPVGAVRGRNTYRFRVGYRYRVRDTAVLSTSADRTNMDLEWNGEKIVRRRHPGSGTL